MFATVLIYCISKYLSNINVWSPVPAEELGTYVSKSEIIKRVCSIYLIYLR